MSPSETTFSLRKGECFVKGNGVTWCHVIPWTCAKLEIPAGKKQRSDRSVDEDYGFLPNELAISKRKKCLCPLQSNLLFVWRTAFNMV